MLAFWTNGWWLDDLDAAKDKADLLGSKVYAAIKGKAPTDIVVYIPAATGDLGAGEAFA